MTRLMGALAGLGVTLLTLSARADPNDSDYGWRRRFELEQPSIIRYVEGMPIPPGYERETHYDGRLVAVGALNFAGGYLIGVGTTALLERTEPVNFVPCVG
ncbi:MAG TPA: hypothetical protein VM686_40540, partial [Polyangiaceae bacterium]|nr:hypothetical protein [Polyangiaceae bacterium]